MKQRGFVFVPFLLANWKLIVVGLAVALLAWHEYHCWTVSRDFELYKAQVQAQSELFKAEQARKELERAKLSQQREKEHETQVKDLSAKYAAARATAKRLSSDNSSLQGRVRALSDAAKQFDCGSGQTDLAGRLERLESGVLGLLERGDQAIVRAATCKAWLDDQLKVK